MKEIVAARHAIEHQQRAEHYADMAAKYAQRLNDKTASLYANLAAAEALIAANLIQLAVHDYVYKGVSEDRT